MPHTRIPPDTVEGILATGESDPEWTKILEAQPIPSGSTYGDINTLKKLSTGTLPRLQAGLAATRPADLIEAEISIDIPATDLKPEAGCNRALVCYRDTTLKNGSNENENDEGWPVIVIFHGGGHTVGNPESELPLARLLIQKFNAVVVLPCYRLAPEHRFPSGFSDALETVKQVATDTLSLSQPTGATDKLDTRVLPVELAGKVNAKSGFIVGGTSAGATISTSISHLCHKWRTSSPSSEARNAPPLTGLLLACGTCINPHKIPSAYKHLYHSRKQNEDALPLDKDLSAMFRDAMKPDYDSPIYCSIDQQPHLSRDMIGNDHMWLKDEAVRVYFQVCGQDMSRDDALIYEKVLREEVGAQTRMDLYSGFGHVFWGMGGGYGGLEMSKRRMEHSVEGVSWLLGRDGGGGS